MFKNMNPVVKRILYFVFGCLAMLAAEWGAAMIKGRTFEVNWLYIIGMGIFITVLDIIMPAEQRRKNRENLNNRFKG